MAILDTDRILNGTDTKQLINAYENLKSSYSNDSAKGYCSYYKGKPLSFIMKNARYIIAEPQFGLPFVQWVATSFPLTFTNLTNLRGCICSYLDEYGNRMDSRVKDLYTNAHGVISEACNKRVCEGAMESRFEDPKAEEFLDTIYGALCSKRLENNDDVTKGFFDGYSPYRAECEDLNSYIKSYPTMSKILYTTPYATELCLESELCESFMDLMTDKDGFENKAKNLVACETVQELLLSERFAESVNNFRNGNLRTLVTGMMSADIANEVISSFKEAVDDTINPVYSSTLSAVNAIMEESVYDDIYKEDRDIVKSGMTSLKHEVYESVRQNIHSLYEVMEETDILPETPLFTVIKESMGVTGEVTVMEAYKLITEATAEAEANNRYFFESEKDGAMNSVIANKHKALSAKQVPNKKAVTSVSNDDEEDSIEEDDEKELPEATKVDSKDLPDSSNPNSTKPQKPKQGVIGTIQNKALDAHAKSKQVGSKLRQLGTSVKNAGTAVLKIPAGLLAGLKGIIKGFDDMDDNRRKQYMLQPGYRKRIFKNLRVAATYGLAGYCSALLVPVVWFGRKLSKEKNKRIRNEFASELETEIKVCEEKINDAQARDDKEAKYQLMRIRDSLARERERVQMNGKYI